VSVAIVDLGCGNVGAVSFALERLGATHVVTSDGDEIAKAGRVILPGVGSAAFAMERIRQLHLQPVLKKLEQPVLGICLGMHLLFQHSEEGETDCLGLIPGTVRKLAANRDNPVPNMGWCKLKSFDSKARLNTGDHVYFAHSYACDLGPNVIAAATHNRAFAAAVRHDNWTGVQFHPERSGKAGQRVLAAFLA
jgi:glutamine amidotransferase